MYGVEITYEELVDEEYSLYETKVVRPECLKFQGHQSYDLCVDVIERIKEHHKMVSENTFQYDNYKACDWFCFDEKHIRIRTHLGSELFNESDQHDIIDCFWSSWCTNLVSVKIYFLDHQTFF